MEEHAGAGILVRVDVPDLKSQTRIVISKTDPVGLAKQAVLEKLSHVSEIYNYMHTQPMYCSKSCCTHT